MTKDLTKENILIFLKKEEIENEPIGDLEKIEDLCKILEGEFNTIFSVVISCNSSQSDYWLQADYYSNKIKKTIIFDYDYQSNYENLEELADVYIATAKKIEEFEKKLIAS